MQGGGRVLTSRTGDLELTEISGARLHLLQKTSSFVIRDVFQRVTLLYLH